MALSLPDGPLFDALLPRRDDHAMDEDARRVDAVGIERTRFDELLDLGDAHPARGRGHRIEVPSSLPVLQIAEAVAAPCGDKREVADDAALHHVHPAVELARLLPLGDDGAVAGGREERRDPRAARAHPFGESPLWCELHFELAGEKLALELRVLADVRRDHLADLPRLEEEAEAPVVDAGVVRDAGQSLHALLHQRVDQIFGNPAEPEAADDERSEEHTSELQSQSNLVCRLLLEKKKKLNTNLTPFHQHIAV